jgi:hypothetical protein
MVAIALLLTRSEIRGVGHLRLAEDLEIAGGGMGEYLLSRKALQQAT